MIGLILGIAAVIAFALWLSRRNEQAGTWRPAPRTDDIDYAELEAAEREVRDLGATARPDDEVIGGDWGPGTSKPRPPELL
ncbi:MAG TPA: hypothetical protein VFT04_09035 [Gemmatimonadales bacterium]|nr:hypothetical protein [Gemmatimonadales bacterium]